MLSLVVHQRRSNNKECPRFNLTPDHGTCPGSALVILPLFVGKLLSVVNMDTSAAGLNMVVLDVERMIKNREPMRRQFLY